MFGWGSSRKRSLVDELNKTLLIAYEGLHNSAGKGTKLERQAEATIVFNVLMETFAQHFPNLVVEPGSPLAVVMSQGLQKPDWELIDRDFDYIFDQVVRGRDLDDGRKLIVMWSFIRPSAVAERLSAQTHVS